MQLFKLKVIYKVTSLTEQSEIIVLCCTMLTSGDPVRSRGVVSKDSRWYFIISRVDLTPNTKRSPYLVQTGMVLHYMQSLMEWEQKQNAKATCPTAAPMSFGAQRQVYYIEPTWRRQNPKHDTTDDARARTLSRLHSDTRLWLHGGRSP